MYWVIVSLLVLFVASMIAGQSAAPSTTTGGKNCDDCKKDFDWYESLRPGKKALYAGWWVARKTACAMNGC